MAVRIMEVARQAGVSTATVSRALRGLPNVAPATRQRVTRVAAELGYRPHPHATGLATGRSSAIGMVVPHLSSWFSGRVAQGAHEVVAAQRRHLVLLAASRGNGMAELASPNLSQLVAGLVVVDLPSTPDCLGPTPLPSVPLVAVGAASGLEPAIKIDDRRAAAAAVSHLCALGHRRIGLLGDLEAEAPGSHVPGDRRRGYLDALVAAGIKPSTELQESGRFTAHDGAAATKRLLALAAPPTAIFAMSDEMAIGALGVLREQHLRVPVDVAVIGFDDHELAAHVGLSTIRQRPTAQGRQAAAWLLSRLAGDDPPPPMPATWELIVRSSTVP